VGKYFGVSQVLHMTVGSALISIDQHNFSRNAGEQESIGCR
jgi:hypothetical protein